MALDRWSLPMIAPYIKGSDILCLGYPDMLVFPAQVEEFLRVTPRKFANYGADHKVDSPVPETVDTLLLAGAVSVDCVDIVAARGVERVINLNERQAWPKEYGLVINPGTTEHCFDIACATFNAWRAVAVGGALLNVAPATMINHGFYNVCPTMIVDFAAANGGKVMKFVARDKKWNKVEFDPVRRCAMPGEVVTYAVIVKERSEPEQVPTQWRYRQ